MSRFYTYTGLATNPKRRKHWKGKRDPESYKQLRRAPGFRFPRFCKHLVEGKPCGAPHAARGYCRKHYDSVFRKLAEDLAPRKKRPRLTPYQKQIRAGKRRIVYMRRDVAVVYAGLRDTMIAANRSAKAIDRARAALGLPQLGSPMLLL